jgi:hypothetical protein
MDIIQIGHLGHQFYRLGWQNDLQQTLAPTQYLLLKHFTQDLTRMLFKP